MKVRVRPYEVDVKGLKHCLKHRKQVEGLSVVQIATQLQVPKTTVEHWFRQDDCFSIPDPQYWLSLKELLGIDTSEFDKSILTFVEREGVYEKSNRVYDEHGIAPTLTTISMNEKILMRCPL